MTKVILAGLELDFSQDPVLGVRAIELANNFSLLATYDAYYLALAERESCEFWTADTRMWNAVKGKFAWVRWMGDYHTGQN
jgi:predicted nucleic acid-binding protein